MAQLVMIFLCKHIKSKMWWYVTVISALRRQRQAYPGGLLGRQSSQNGKLQAKEKSGQKQCGWSQGITPKIDFYPLQVCSCAFTHALEHVRVNICFLMNSHTSISECSHPHSHT